MLTKVLALILVASAVSYADDDGSSRLSPLTVVTRTFTSTITSVNTATITTKSICYSTSPADLKPCRRKREAAVLFGLDDNSEIAVQQFIRPSKVLYAVPTLVPVFKVQSSDPSAGVRSSPIDSSLPTDDEQIILGAGSRTFTFQQVVQAVAELVRFASTTTVTTSTTVFSLTASTVPSKVPITLAGCLPPNVPYPAC